MAEPGSAEQSSPVEPSIIVAYRDGVTILDLVGEHDMSTAAELGSRIDEQAARHRNLVVSLRDADFVDSAIVQVLFRGDRKLRASGKRLVLHTECDTIVERVLEVSGVREQLDCRDTLDEAVALAARG